MNINKKLIKGTAITAAAVTLMATAGISMVNAADTDKIGVNQGNIVNVADNTAVNVKADGTAFKDETVYVMADASGAAKKIIVSDWLKNFNASAGLSDFSTLSNLVNVKGNETFEQSSNQVTWNADGKDIYYQGNTEAELPVNVKVTYTLDGVEMSAADLVGKSGKLTVRYDYTNTLKHTADINGKTEDIYTPLLMITGAVLPTDKYTNVEVTNGKVISDGNKQMVVGIALPGLTDSLKTDSDKLDVPEFFEYTADVTEYEANTALSVGLTDILSGMDVNGTDIDVDDIQKKVDELVDGVDQLADGSRKLYDGTGDLTDATSKFCDGTNKLSDGTNKLYDGSNTLYDGISTLLSKTGDFKKGVNTLSSSLTTLKGALTKLETGAKTLDNGAASLATGAATLNKGLGTAKAGMDQIVGNYGKVTEGANQLSGGAASLASGADKLQGGLETANATYAKLSETVANDQALIEALKKVNAGYNDANIAAIIAKMEANTAGQKQIADGLTAAGGQLVEGAKNLSAGAAVVKNGADTLAGGVKALSEGSLSVQAGLTKLYAGSGDLLAGAKKLNQGTTSLVSNAKQLAGAGTKLEDGGKNLLSATDQLSAGITKLQTGSGTLKDGMGTLKDNVVTLKDGAKELDNGANTLKDGAGKLKDGIKTLQDDGISKVTDLVNGDLSNVIERFKAVVDESKAYKNYSGIGDDMDGSVKFIIKYED